MTLLVARGQFKVSVALRSIPVVWTAQNTKVPANFLRYRCLWRPQLDSKALAKSMWTG